MKSLRLSSALMCAALLNGAVALADEKNFFVQVNGGLAVNKATGLSNNDITDASSNTGSKKANSAVMGLEFGYKVNSNFRFSLGLDYINQYKVSYNDTSSKTDIGASYTETEKDYARTDYKIKSLVAMMNLYYDIAEIKGFTPYLTAGLGVARNTAKANLSQHTNIQTTLLGQPQPEQNSYQYPSYNSKSNYNFAYKLGLGSRYKFNDNISFDVRYQYVDLGKYKTSETNGVAFNNTTGEFQSSTLKNRKGSLKSHQFLFGISYNF